MDQSSDKPDQLRDVQAPLALNRLQDAVAEHVEDLNRRFNAGLAVSGTESTFEVREAEKAGALVRVSLTGQNDIQYSRFIKYSNEMEPGTIYVQAGTDGIPKLMFPDFPHPNVEVSYQDASKRLVDSSF